MCTFITQEKNEETHKDSAYNSDKKALSYKIENNPVLNEDGLFTKNNVLTIQSQQSFRKKSTNQSFNCSFIDKIS